jgi:flagellar FliL protein
MAKTPAKQPANAGKAQPRQPTKPPAKAGAAKSGGMMMLVLGLVGGGLVATGGGWFLGGMIAGAAIERLAPAAEKPAASPLSASGGAVDAGAEKSAGKDGHEEKAAAAEKEDEGSHGDGHGGTGPVETLPAITTNLAGPGDSWIRLELAVLVKGGDPLDADEKSVLADAFLAALRNTTLQSITGPSGMLHLREDLTDTALLAAGERIAEIRIVSMVVE